jgi:protein arginine N-methyltransferase 1
MASDYSLDAYGRMIKDAGRMDAYERALKQTVSPGDTVLDLGAGIGAMSLLALRCGATRVEAIEPSPVIALAEKVARENQVDSKINFHAARVQETVLVSQVNVIVADVRGALPLFYDGLAAMFDARDRLLLPQGKMIPRQDTIWVAPVSSDYWRSEILGCYEGNRFGWSVDAVTQALRHRLFSMRPLFSPPRLLAPPQLWWEIDYHTEKASSHEASMHWSVTEEGLADGVAVWFDTELAEGVHFSNYPGKSQLIYGWVFLPWSQSLELQVGDQVKMRLRAKLMGLEYIWVWETEYRSSTQGTVQTFSQTTFVADHRPLSHLK